MFMLLVLALHNTVHIKYILYMVSDLKNCNNFALCNIYCHGNNTELERFLRKNILAVYFFAKLGYTF